MLPWDAQDLLSIGGHQHAGNLLLDILEITDPKIRIQLFIFLQGGLNHESKKFCDKICFHGFVGSGFRPTRKVSPPSTGPFRRGWRASLSIRFQGSEGKVIGRHIVSDVRKFVQRDAYVRNLGEAISIRTATRG